MSALTMDLETVLAVQRALDEALPESFYQATVALMFTLHRRWEAEGRADVETFSMFVCGLLAGIQVGERFPTEASS